MRFCPTFSHLLLYPCLGLSRASPVWVVDGRDESGEQWSHAITRPESLLQQCGHRIVSLASVSLLQQPAASIGTHSARSPVLSTIAPLGKGKRRFLTATGPTFIARSNPPAAFSAMSLLVLVVRQQETWRNGLTPWCAAEPKSVCRRRQIRDP
jgi:hypothetical protein